MGDKEKATEEFKTQLSIVEKIGVPVVSSVIAVSYTHLYMATFVDNKISSVPLSDVAGKTKMVNIDNQLVLQAKKLGICLGE